MVAPLLIAILTLPLYLRVIGQERFGVLSLVWLLFGYFGLFDFGLSRATANRLAQLRDEPVEQRAEVFYTSLAFNLVFGIATGLAFYAVAFPLLTYLSSSAGALSAELPAALPWVAALFPLGMVGGVLTGSLEAEERFLAINIQQIVGTVLLQAMPLAAVLVFGVSLEAAVIGAAGARVVSILWNAATCYGSVRNSGRPRIRLAVAPSLMRYGGWVTVTNAISPLLISADQFLIAAQLGSAAVAQYSVLFTFTTKALALPLAASRALFPRLSNLRGEDAKALALRATGTVACMMTILCAPAVLVVDLALRIWLGADFAETSAPVARTLLVGTWVNGIAFVPVIALQAQGRPDLVAKFHALEVLPFIALLVLCLHLFGLPGAAYAWTMRTAVDAGLLLWATGALGRSVRQFALPGLIMVAAWLWATMFPAPATEAVLEAVLFGIGVVAFLALTDPGFGAMVRSAYRRARQALKVPRARPASSPPGR